MWVRALREHPDGFDEAMFTAATAHAVDSSAKYLSRLLLETCSLPFDCAQRLVSRRGVSAIELVRFFERGDAPTAVAEKHASTETRVSVLAALAALPGLSPAVFDRLAGFDSSRLRFALLTNPDTSPCLRADAAAALHVSRLTEHQQRRLRLLLFNDVPVQPLVFDRFRTSQLDVATRCFAWAGLSTSQLHRLLDIVEEAYVAAGAVLDDTGRTDLDPVDDDPELDLCPDFWCLFDALDHPALDGPGLSRVVRLRNAASWRVPPGQWAAALNRAESRVAADVAATDVASCDVLSLRRLIAAGLCHNPAVWRAVASNPCFDLGVAADLAGSVDFAEFDNPGMSEALYRSCSRAASTLPELFVVQARTRSEVCDNRLFSHASEPEAAATLLSVQNSPRLTQVAVRGLCSYASPEVLSDRVVSLFLWDPRMHGGSLFVVSETDYVSRARRAVFDFLSRRFADNPQAWPVFFDLVAGSDDELLPVGATAELALVLSAG